MWLSLGVSVSQRVGPFEMYFLKNKALKYQVFISYSEFIGEIHKLVV